jgi:hypothetical protein
VRGLTIACMSLKECWLCIIKSGRGKWEVGSGKREEGRGKREEGRGKEEEGRGSVM